MAPPHPFDPETGKNRDAEQVATVFGNHFLRYGADHRHSRFFSDSGLSGLRPGNATSFLFEASWRLRISSKIASGWFSNMEAYFFLNLRVSSTIGSFHINQPSINSIGMQMVGGSKPRLRQTSSIFGRIAAFARRIEAVLAQTCSHRGRQRVVREKLHRATDFARGNSRSLTASAAYLKDSATSSCSRSGYDSRMQCSY